MGMRLRVWSCALVLLSGCWGDETVLFPPGLEPVTPVNEAVYPVGDAADPYPERLEVALTYAEGVAGRPPSVHARGYVHAPLSAVWEALRTPDVSADRRNFESYTVETDVEPEYDFSYRIHAVVQDIVTVRYTTTFRHGVFEGTVQDPVSILEAWQKTEGSTIIRELRGSAVARAISPDVTAIELMQFSRTPASNHPDNEAYLRDVYDAVVALSHGRPLPPTP